MLALTYLISLSPFLIAYSSRRQQYLSNKNNGAGDMLPHMRIGVNLRHKFYIIPSGF